MRCDYGCVCSILSPVRCWNEVDLDPATQRWPRLLMKMWICGVEGLDLSTTGNRPCWVDVGRWYDAVETWWRSQQRPSRLWSGESVLSWWKARGWALRRLWWVEKWWKPLLWYFLLTILTITNLAMDVEQWWTTWELWGCGNSTNCKATVKLLKYF